MLKENDIWRCHLNLNHKIEFYFYWYIGRKIFLKWMGMINITASSCSGGRNTEEMRWRIVFSPVELKLFVGHTRLHHLILYKFSVPELFNNSRSRKINQKPKSKLKICLSFLKSYWYRRTCGDTVLKLLLASHCTDLRLYGAIFWLHISKIYSDIKVRAI